jgi:hypothetical protein
MGKMEFCLNVLGIYGIPSILRLSPLACFIIGNSRGHIKVHSLRLTDVRRLKHKCSVGYSLSRRKIWNVVKIFKGGKIDEKDCVDDFVVGFDFGVGRVPLVASWR